MKWIDYREKLGIGICDYEKTIMLANKISNRLGSVFHLISLEYNLSIRFSDIIDAYFTEIGECIPFQATLTDISANIANEKTINGIISKYIAFLNIVCKSRSKKDHDVFWKILKDSLDELAIDFTTINDNNGIFVYPKGAKELDDALVSQPLEWLSSYPKAHQTFVHALKQYADGEYIRDAADNLRKALEAFFQEFLGNKKNLETNKIEICRYLGEQGVDAGVSGLFQPLINAYKNINDRIVKHNDAVDKTLLEFLLYQTGLLIRMVITVKQAQKEALIDAD
ncbi:MAG: hypothetical protein IJJ99_09150 [Oscillospiraceae bacterium]|nr:hypothetical protein [Oscillospiraceae bacterium]